MSEAIRTVHPFGVDLCSGIRTEGALDEAETNLLGTYKDQEYLTTLSAEDQSTFLNDAISQYGALPDDQAIAEALESYEAKQQAAEGEALGEEAAVAGEEGEVEEG